MDQAKLTDQARTFQLERFYLGMIMPDKQKAPTLQLLARSPGVRMEQIAECHRLAALLPPPPTQRTDQMPASIGIFRGETVDYIIATAQQALNGAPQFEYLLTPASALRSLSGNLAVFEEHAKEKMPQFPAQRTDLPVMVLEDPVPPDTEMQTDYLMAIIGYCKNNLKTVGSLLAGLVQAWGLGIINAPLSLTDRLAFVQGLLALLPAPARVAITFATSVIDPSVTNTQIKFLTSNVQLTRHLMFDWATGKLLNDPPEDAYSKFILSQLRLDTSLVIEQTEKLARTAVWRAMRKDDMANALAWVSKRASLDSAVQDGLPADRAMVTGVLREDPTLPDDLRIAYSRHLLKMSLAMDDPEQTDIIPVITQQNRELADVIYGNLKAAAEGDQAEAVYHMVYRWITQPPMGADVTRWRSLLNISLLARTNALLPGDVADLVKFLEQLLDAPESLQLEGVVAQIIAISRRCGYDNAEGARIIFLLAVTFVPAGGLQRLLSDIQLINNLPETLRAVFPHLTPKAPGVAAAPTGILAKASEVFGVQRQAIILARFIEWALLIQRYDLLDAETLNGLVKVAGTPTGANFDLLIQHVVQDMSQPEVLPNLGLKARQYLAELSLARGRYGEAIAQLEMYHTTLYKGIWAEEMAAIARGAFAEAPLDAKKMTEALQAVQEIPIKTVARADCYIGALTAFNWGSDMEVAARRLTSLVFNEPRLASLMGVEPTLKLLKANADRRDAMEAARLASAIVEFALTLDPVGGGASLVDRVYPMLNWNADMQEISLEILRTYVRRAPLDQATNFVAEMTKKYGVEVGYSLEVAYKLRLVLGGSSFQNFAEQVRFAALLLLDMALTYTETREVPQIHRLRRTVEEMPGGLSGAERKRLSANLNRIGEQVMQLYRQHQARSGRRSRNENEVYRNQLLSNEIAPANGVDALFWLGGRFSGGVFVPLSLAREAPAHLLGNRSVNMLLKETDLLVSLCDGLLSAFPPHGQDLLNLRIWSIEVDNLWKALSLHNQRLIQGDLFEDLQILAQLVIAIGEKGSERSLQNSGQGHQLRIGKAQPKSVIDALPWMSGYFAHEHQN